MHQHTITSVGRRKNSVARVLLAPGVREDYGESEAVGGILSTCNASD
jgi:hypothetical protein